MQISMKKMRHLFGKGILLMAFLTLGLNISTIRNVNVYAKPDSRISRPNILFILADDMGYNDVGYHGSEIKTPNLDKLAMGGLRLENYYVQPICSPTRSQLLTGRYQIHTGLQNSIIWHADTRSIPLDSKTIADKLSDAGYSTHLVGKWHLGYAKKEYLPTRRGFHSFFGFLNGHSDYFKYVSRHRRFHGYDLRENEARAKMRKYEGQYSTKLFADKTINIFKRQNKGDKPLFVYLSFQAPHSPLQVPEEYIKQYQFIKEENRRTYAGMVTCMDEAIGNITRALKEMGRWDNTLLIFSTDNGGEYSMGSNRPLRGYKGNHWEGGIRAVGFVHGQQVNKKLRGTVSHEMMHVSDWFPTLVNMVGGDFNGTKPLDGFDQWETISEGKPSKRDEILINIDPLSVETGKAMFNDTFNTRIYAALRMGKWKILTGRIGSNAPKKCHPNVCLFDIEKDPGEYKDLSAKEPTVVRQLLDRLQYHHRTAVPALEPRIDSAANPSFNGGFWGPWLD